MNRREWLQRAGVVTAGALIGRRIVQAASNAPGYWYEVVIDGRDVSLVYAPRRLTGEQMTGWMVYLTRLRGIAQTASIREL